MESFAMESDQSRQSAPLTVCGLQARGHIKANAGLNLLVLGLMLASALTPHWFSYEGSEFSLTGINLKEEGGWQDYSTFRKRCESEALQEREDYKAECAQAKRFQFAGTVCMIFLISGMCVQVYNSLSVASLGWQLPYGLQRVDVSDRQFTHLAGPVVYAFALAGWVSLLKVAFYSSFMCGPGFIIAITTAAFDFAVAMHYRNFRTLLESEGKPEQASLIAF